MTGSQVQDGPEPAVKLRQTRFVSSRDIPDDMAEAVALVTHRRGCGSFDGGSGNQLHAVPFTDGHKRHDVTWAGIFLADVCNALKITPDQLAGLRTETTRGEDVS